jgi:hypothetical protein
MSFLRGLSRAKATACQSTTSGGVESVSDACGTLLVGFGHAEQRLVQLGDETPGRA